MSSYTSLILTLYCSIADVAIAEVNSPTLPETVKFFKHHTLAPYPVALIDDHDDAWWVNLALVGHKYYWVVKVERIKHRLTAVGGMTQAHADVSLNITSDIYEPAIISSQLGLDSFSACKKGTRFYPSGIYAATNYWEWKPQVSEAQPFDRKLETLVNTLQPLKKQLNVLKANGVVKLAVSYTGFRADDSLLQIDNKIIHQLHELDLTMQIDLKI